MHFRSLEGRWGQKEAAREPGAKDLKGSQNSPNPEKGLKRSIF